MGSSDTAVPYTLDVADFYNVPAATTQPANTVSVTSYGADPTGVNDSTSAFNQAITAANSAGEAVWIPSGTFLISSHLQIQAGTIEGAGDWYSQIKTNELIDNTSDVAGPINLSGFAILGSTVGRHDDSTANAIDGSLGSGWTVNGLWIQDTNVGMWLQFGNSNCTVENSVIESTDADGVNFNGNASSCTVKNNFIRGTGDDSLAIWSYPTADSNITFANNTIVAPTLANGIADYGGDNNTISNNVVADDNALGSGIDISNEEFLTPFTPLTGTINVTGNYLIRAGAYNPNWDHPMGAVQFDSYDSAFTGVTVNYSGGAILDSPYEAFEFVSGSGNGYAASGHQHQQRQRAERRHGRHAGGDHRLGQRQRRDRQRRRGGRRLQRRLPGTNTAGCLHLQPRQRQLGLEHHPGAHHLPEPGAAGRAERVADDPVVRRRGFGVDQLGADGDGLQPGHQRGVGIVGQRHRAVQPDQHLRQLHRRGRHLHGQREVRADQRRPAHRHADRRHQRTRRADHRRAVRHRRDLHHEPGAGAACHGEQLRIRPTSPANVTDGNTSTLLGEHRRRGLPADHLGRPGLRRSRSARSRWTCRRPRAWSTRTETLSVLGSTNGTSYSQIVGSAGYTFNPSTGNTVTISLPSGTSARYVELSFTGNTGWSAAQLSEFEVFPGGGSSGGSSSLSASPSSVSFGSETVGSTSSAQTVTVSNPGTVAASVSSVSVSGPFSQTNTCGSSIAAGGSCTVSVKFAPTASGAASGTLSVASSAPGSPLTVALSGTGTSSNTDLALNAPVTASSYTQVYVPANAVDGNTSSYWEANNGAWPSTITVNLQSLQTLGSITIDLPPSSAWNTRTQTLSVLGSTNGTSFSTLVSSATYTWNPSTGNTVTIPLPRALATSTWSSVSPPTASRTAPRPLRS